MSENLDNINNNHPEGHSHEIQSDDLEFFFTEESPRLNNLYNIPGSKKTSKRVGRGIGSGKGKTSGRGTKGQKARSGVAIKGFEGGQMPIIARLPKRGFNPLKRKNITALNLYVINMLFEDEVIKEDQVIDKAFLKSWGLIKKASENVKLLGKDELLAKFNFKLDFYSKTASEKILSSGGSL